MACSNEILTNAMTEAGARNGFTDVTADFFAFRDFKLNGPRRATGSPSRSAST